MPLRCTWAGCCYIGRSPNRGRSRGTCTSSSDCTCTGHRGGVRHRSGGTTTAGMIMTCLRATECTACGCFSNSNALAPCLGVVCCCGRVHGRVVYAACVVGWHVSHQATTPNALRKVPLHRCRSAFRHPNRVPCIGFWHTCRHELWRRSHTLRKQCLLQ